MKNDVFVDMFVSIDSAIEEMVNENSDYLLELFGYDRVGPLLLSTSVREYKISTTLMPVVNSIKNIGNQNWEPIFHGYRNFLLIASNSSLIYYWKMFKSIILLLILFHLSLVLKHCIYKVISIGFSVT